MEAVKKFSGSGAAALAELLEQLPPETLALVKSAFDAGGRLSLVFTVAIDGRSEIALDLLNEFESHRIVTCGTHHAVTH